MCRCSSRSERSAASRRRPTSSPRFASPLSEGRGCSGSSFPPSIWTRSRCTAFPRGSNEKKSGWKPISTLLPPRKPSDRSAFDVKPTSHFWICHHLTIINIVFVPTFIHSSVHLKFIMKVFLICSSLSQLAKSLLPPAPHFARFIVHMYIPAESSI
jgi:hypothetical protein